jgi:3-dehydroquinate dehydratase-2
VKILIINGPNLNLLGKRDTIHYGKRTLSQLQTELTREAKLQGSRLVFFQSNYEGALVDFIQQNAGDSSGIIINPGALAHYGLSLRDALADCGLPVIEVHISNIYAREEWRARSITAPVCRGQITGLGPAVYRLALMALRDLIGTDKQP